MKNLLPLILIFGLLVACTKEDKLPDNCAGDVIFRYDTLSGKCVNCRGETGYNTFDLDQVISTKSGECMKFSKIHLVYVLDTAQMENFIELGQNEIRGFNFNGADLDSTSLFFNDLINCNFKGAKMYHIEFGYARIYGKIDNFTEHPEGCQVLVDSIFCIR